jgi:cytochrome c biogenesis protein CcdA
LAGLAGHAFISGGRGATLAAFLTAALTMTALMFGLALLIGLAQTRTIALLKAGTQQIKRWSGAVLVVVGAWLIALALWADFFARFFPV